MFASRIAKPKTNAPASPADTRLFPNRAPVAPRADRGLPEHGSADTTPFRPALARATRDFAGIPVFAPSHIGQTRLQRSAFPAKPPEPRAPHSSRRGNAAGGVPPIVHEVLSTPGKPLEPATRDYFELRLGRDFSHVRVHTDTKSIASTQAINSLAYTMGPHVVLGSPQHLLGDPSGDRLMAHELTHVAQQESAAAARRPTGIGPAHNDYEREADAVAARIGTGGSTIPSIAKHAADPVVQRALPAAVEAIEVALTATIVLQEEHAITLGRLTVVSGTASRRGDPPQPKDRDNSARIMTVSRTHPVYPNVYAELRRALARQRFRRDGRGLR